MVQNECIVIFFRENMRKILDVRILPLTYPASGIYYPAIMPVAGEFMQAKNLPLSPKQAAMLRAVKRLSRGSYGPTYDELGAAVGVRSSNTVRYHLNKLEARGYLRRDPREPRSTVLLPKGLEAAG